MSAHIPVMLEQVITSLQPKSGGLYVDGTFGAGGYSRAILDHDGARVIAIDRDPDVQPTGALMTRAYPGRFILAQSTFSNMDGVVTQTGTDKVDGVVLDVGVSSMQLDQAERGFSFMREGPLDMRMAQSGPSASDAVNYMSETDLSRMFSVYGEEKQSRRIARAIVQDRKATPFLTTLDLAGLIERIIRKSGKIHPATRVFQALRIFINDELGELSRALHAAERILKPAGRLVVVSFHSLEDRIVKRFLRARAGLSNSVSRHVPDSGRDTAPTTFDLPRKGALTATDQELSDNPRARSARLRVGLRNERGADLPDVDLLPKVPSLFDLERAMA